MMYEPATDDVVSHIATSGVHMSGPCMCVSVSVNVSEPGPYTCLDLHLCIGVCMFLDLTCVCRSVNTYLGLT